MPELMSTLWIELRKARRSRMPLVTALGFLLIPAATGFLMFIYKDPVLARQTGLLSAKANLMVASADWPTYLNMLLQAISIAGFFLFGLICSWVFGREFVDGTAKDLLAVPVARSSILAGKFVVVGLWSAALTGEAYVATVLIGVALDLPQASLAVLADSALRLALTGLLVFAVVLPWAFFASAGRGYLLPIGLTLVAVLFANVIATVGWGSLFPWAVPALFAGMGGPDPELSPVSYGLVVLTGLVGILATYRWWQTADQTG